MSAPTGITVSPELTQAFSEAVDSQAVRFLKVSIRNGVYSDSYSIRPDFASHATVVL